MAFIGKQRGFSLLEVLIAFVIIMVSVVSLVGLHRFYMKSEINSAMLNGAMQLAETKLDDLRSFDSIAASGSVTAYENIDTDKGGVIASGANPVGKYNYNLTWNVTNSDLTGFTIPSDNTIYPSKNVTVNVSWINSDGNNRSISLNGVVSSIVSVDSGQITNSSVASGVNPKVNYTPGAAPDVISISLGNQLKQETTKPFPKVTSTQGNKGSSITVNFQNITYNSTNNTQVLVDTSTVSCDCKFSDAYSGGSVSKNTTLPAQPKLTSGLLYWESQKEIKDKWGVYTYSALTPDKYSTNATQSQTTTCDACCENHFKGKGVTLQDYFNPLNYNDTNKYDKTLTSVSSGDYVDSCRVLRTDGYYSRLLTEAKYTDGGTLASVVNYHYGQLLPDWNLVKLNIMSYDFLSKSKNQESYVKYVKYVIGKYVKFQKENAGSLANISNLSSTSVSNKSGSGTYYIQSFKEWLPGNAVSGGDTTIDVNADTLNSYQLIARGIFIDLLPSSWLDSISINTDGSISDGDLQKVSFNDVNLTLLVRWSPERGGSSIAYVSNDDIKTMNTSSYDSAYYGVYKRGELTVPKKNAGAQIITAKAFRGNSSISAYQGSDGKEFGVTSYDNNTDEQITSSLNVTVGTVLPSDKVTISGRVYCYSRTATDKTTGNKTTTVYGVDACSASDFSLIDQPTIANSTDPSATCYLYPDITSSAYRKLECTVLKGASFGLNFTKGGASLTGSSSPYAIKPHPITFLSTYTATTSDSTCIQVYDQNISTTNGINLPKCTY